MKKYKVSQEIIDAMESAYALLVELSDLSSHQESDDIVTEKLGIAIESVKAEG
jgi:hypothetical protein